MQISTVLRLTGRKLNHHRTTSSQRFHSFICNSIDFLFHPLLSIPLQFPKYNTTVSLTPFFPCSGKIKIIFVESKMATLITYDFYHDSSHCSIRIFLPLPFLYYFLIAQKQAVRPPKRPQKY